jgi:dTDP-4-dehydrorhamnose 3,5-epimerase
MSNRFKLIETPMAGLKLLGRLVMGDERGSLSRLYDAEDMLEMGWSGGIAQINHTLTRQAGTVRGMHYQNAPFAEAKLVTCLAGRILDVAVDIREGSPTFLRHFATELSEANHRSLMIGPGFAHGFQALCDNAVLIYAHSAPYRADAEGGFNPADPRLAIHWPLPMIHLSARDQAHPAIEPEFRGVET